VRWQLCFVSHKKNGKKNEEEPFEGDNGQVELFHPCGITGEAWVASKDLKREVAHVFVSGMLGY
jgi:hypothetical protein